VLIEQIVSQEPVPLAHRLAHRLAVG